MVLLLKHWKSRASPGIEARAYIGHKNPFISLVKGRRRKTRPFIIGGAGWSSPVARQAHNLKVVGSNPTPATKQISIKPFRIIPERFFYAFSGGFAPFPEIAARLIESRQIPGHRFAFGGIFWGNR